MNVIYLNYPHTSKILGKYISDLQREEEYNVRLNNVYSLSKTKYTYNHYRDFKNLKTKMCREFSIQNNLKFIHFTQIYVLLFTFI